jgi:hypothetical protein
MTSAGGATVALTQTVAGTVGANDAGTTVAILDGAAQVGSAFADKTGAWSATVTLSNYGVNTVTATDTDAAGNKEVSNAVVYTVASAATVTSIWLLNLHLSLRMYRTTLPRTRRSSNASAASAACRQSPRQPICGSNSPRDTSSTK